MSECGCGCVCPGGVLSIQAKHSGGIYSSGESTVEDSQRLHSDHEDGAGKSMFMHYWYASYFIAVHWIILSLLLSWSSPLFSFCLMIILHTVWSSYWHDTVVCLSIRLSVTLCIVDKWFIPQQKCLDKSVGSAPPPTNTILLRICVGKVVTYTRHSLHKIWCHFHGITAKIIPITGITVGFLFGIPAETPCSPPLQNSSWGLHHQN